MVDDDRDWLGQLRAVVLVIDALGLVLGGVLLVAAIFTISSVIRLTAYLYRDEIAVMRLVGATEFFIRGPFYLEGLFQGLAGGVLAVAALLGAHAFLTRGGADSLLMSFLASRFLGPATLLALIGLGGLAGLVGAVSSLRKEDLGETAETAGVGAKQQKGGRSPPLSRSSPSEARGELQPAATAAFELLELFFELRGLGLHLFDHLVLFFDLLVEADGLLVLLHPRHPGLVAGELVGLDRLRCTSSVSRRRSRAASRSA